MKKYEYSRTEMDILERSPIPYAVYQFLDKRVVTILLTDGFRELFELPDKHDAYWLMDNDMYRDTHPDDIARIAETAVRYANDQCEYDVVYRSKIKGEYRVIHAFGRHFYPEEGVRLAVIWYVDEGVYIKSESTDIVPLTRQFSNSLNESSLRRKHNYDFLTGIPNMSYFVELAIEGRKRIHESGGNCCVGFANFNGMKYFNRKHGFVEGDNLLRDFATLLARYFGSENCCRIGADNFAFYTVPEDLDLKLKGLLKDLEGVQNGKNITVRIGIYPENMGRVDIKIACDRARFAGTMTKNINNSTVGYFDEKMQAFERNRQYVLDNLDMALEENWIQAFYQPIVRASNGKVCDEEALARWIDPIRGILSPADFIPIIEDAGLIYKIDLYMVDQIIERFKEQKELGYYIVPISVNLSRTDFDACDIVEEIRKRVDAAGIDRKLLTIEITESVVGSDFEFIKSQVERFQELGFRVWMDDFGSGYSSLDVLQSIRFDVIKFDMRFMKQFNNGKNSRVILTELMKMAIGLDIGTVCEGVETAEQVNFLREIGCTELQGYYYSKPIPFAEIVERNRTGRQIGFENPLEASYYEAVGRINLYDMAITTLYTMIATKKQVARVGETRLQCLLDKAYLHRQFLQSA